ncbi:glucan synthase [Diplocarpon rosae]|nr:glucan synthase [Diplocarpon rosae]
MKSEFMGINSTTITTEEDTTPIRDTRDTIREAMDIMMNRVTTMPMLTTPTSRMADTTRAMGNMVAIIKTITMMASTTIKEEHTVQGGTMATHKVSRDVEETRRRIRRPSATSP